MTCLILVPALYISLQKGLQFCLYKLLSQGRKPIGKDYSLQVIKLMLYDAG